MTVYVTSGRSESTDPYTTSVDVTRWHEAVRARRPSGNNDITRHSRPAWPATQQSGCANLRGHDLRVIRPGPMWSLTAPPGRRIRSCFHASLSGSSGSGPGEGSLAAAGPNLETAGQGSAIAVPPCAPGASRPDLPLLVQAGQTVGCSTWTSRGRPGAPAGGSEGDGTADVTIRRS